MIQQSNVKTQIITFFLSLTGTILLAREPNEREFLNQFYGSRETMDFILQADKVTVCRLKAPRDENGKLIHQKLRDDEPLKHYTAEAAIEVPIKIRSDLRQILKDPAIQYT